jgi:hypothetical protein
MTAIAARVPTKDLALIAATPSVPIALLTTSAALEVTPAIVIVPAAARITCSNPAALATALIAPLVVLVKIPDRCALPEMLCVEVANLIAPFKRPLVPTAARAATAERV